MTNELYKGDGSRPVPDPTLLTTAALEAMSSILKDWMEAKLSAVADLADQRYHDLLERIIEHGALDLRTINEHKAETDKEFKAEREMVNAFVARLEERIEGVKSTLDTKIQSHGEKDAAMHQSIVELLDTRFKSSGDLQDARQTAMKEAVQKAEEATNKQIEQQSKRLDDVKDRLGTIEGKGLGMGMILTLGVGAAVIISALIGFSSYLSPHITSNVPSQPQVVIVPATPTK